MPAPPIATFFRRGGASIAAILLALLLPPASLSAQNLTGSFDDWIVLADASMSLALTTDDSNHALGIVCGPDCFVYVESGEPCLEAHVYDARLKAGENSYSVQMQCNPSESGPLLVFPLDEHFLALIDHERMLAIAIRRDDGTSSLVQFPLAGSGPAIHLAMALRPYLRPTDAKGLSTPDKPEAASPFR